MKNFKETKLLSFSFDFVNHLTFVIPPENNLIFSEGIGRVN